LKNCNRWEDLKWVQSLLEEEGDDDDDDKEDGHARRMMKRGHRERKRESNIHAITEMPNLLKTELGAKARAT
jgi:hypothetical protein